MANKLEWIALGIGGAVMAILEQLITNHQVKKEVEKQFEKKNES